MLHLCRIVKATGAEIVLSTAWRLEKSAKERLVQQMTSWGLRPPIGQTPSMGPIENAVVRLFAGKHDNTRPAEITAWLAANHHHVAFPRWVAIDDIDMRAELDPHMVCTDNRVGMTANDADRAILILNNDRPCRCDLCGIRLATSWGPVCDME